MTLAVKRSPTFTLTVLILIHLLRSISPFNKQERFYYSYNQIMEEQQPPLAEITHYSNKIAPRKEQTNKKHTMTSLPDVLNDVQKDHLDDSSNSNHTVEKSLSLHNIHNPAITETSQETINRRVYAFLLQLVQNDSKCQSLIETFIKYEQDIRITVKKSKKQIKDSQTHLEAKSSNDGSEKMLKKKHNKKVRFQDLCQDTENEVISIKMVNSHINCSKKEVTSITQIAKSFGRMFSFTETAVDQKLKNIDKFQDVIIEDQDERIQGSIRKRGISFGKTNFAHKNPSIMMFLDDQSDKQSELFSSACSLIELENIPKSTIQLSEDIIKQIFWTCSPFLVNLSLCLMIKCLTKYKMELKIDNITWLLVVSTVVAYKIFYDEEIQGLTQHYSKLLKMKSEDVVSLQIWFLYELNYEIHVTNHQYFQILSKLLHLQ